MKLTREAMEFLLFGPPEGKRFNQDSAVMPDVWFAFAQDPKAKRDLLITPKYGTSTAALCRILQRRLGDSPGDRRKAALAFNGAQVVVRLTFLEMIRLVFPLTNWWAHRLKEQKEKVNSPGMGWFAHLAGCLATETRKRKPATAEELPTQEECHEAFSQLFSNHRPPSPEETATVWLVQTNRPVKLALTDSPKTIKADAARRVFGLDCSKLVWAVIDSGIDARHPAFAEATDPETSAPAKSRVVKTLDFTRLRDLLTDADAELREELIELESRRLGGLAFDWASVEEQLTIKHDSTYVPPPHPHGTHVAGIIGANWVDETTLKRDTPLVGVCPDIRLWDLRVMARDENGALVGDEFTVDSALQYLRHVNEKEGRFAVVGANVSLSIPHSVKDYGCGWTPVCEETNRLSAAGVVVVAAAGNEGWDAGREAEGRLTAYADISITDPGNAADAITVGATHCVRPHSYGVSYFSSRGPTGDGRLKPDLVAPGEKVVSTYPDGGRKRLDGTSMAAPHVSGAAALLMARHPELKGKPAEIKRLLCESATDLGRDKYFQGCGLLDVLRALQTY
jgi:serine protease AprX